MVAIRAGEAVEARARMPEVLKPNNQHLNNDTLQHPPWTSSFNPFRACLGYQQTTNPTREADSVFKVLSREVKNLSTQFLPERSKTLSVPTPLEGVKTLHVKLVKSLYLSKKIYRTSRWEAD